RLAPELTAASNTAFARNGANRLWAHMMGRGLVHPLDMDHSTNPPSHPQLLELLTAEFAASKFDMRAMLPELALTQTYQRSSEAPAGIKDRPLYSVALLKPLSPEQLGWTLMQATGLTDNQRKALGASATEATLYAKLAGNITPIVNAFAAPPGTP